MYLSETTRQRSAARPGFTLVEMLVATGLVVLIMLMFAQIYSVAISTLREQRGLAQNDQKARILSSILRNDLNNMTFRQPAYPYGDVEGIVALADGDQAIIDPVNQRGYFYYSENSPGNDSDDLLQFTVQYSDAKRFVGRAASLGLTAARKNQPENDDGDDGTTPASNNSVGESSAAEVTYFLRNRVLYRRVVLIREPLVRGTRSDNQPTDGSNRIFRDPDPSQFDPQQDYSGASGSFYNAFDYSATIAGNPSALANEGVLWFHSLESLDNRGNVDFPLGDPRYRFGFNLGGVSREYATSGGEFIGRFTLGEMSDPDFEWPQANPGTNPYTRTVSVNSLGIVAEYNNGQRYGEDILLTNVESFDVEILDDDLGDFSDVAAGFDSWHPDASGTVPYREYVVDTLNTTPTQWSATVAGPLKLDALRGSNAFRYESFGGPGGTAHPEFPPVPGARVSDNGKTWQCFDNRTGVKAVRIRVRFRDVTTDIVRQFTLVHSFVEDH